MIKLVEIVVGASRQSREQTRRICKLLIDGQPRGRLSLSMAEATQLAKLIATSGQLKVDN